MFPICFDNTALVPIHIDSNYYPTGISENIATFETQEGHARFIELPVFERAPCKITSFKLDTGSHYQDVSVIQIDPNGEYIANLSIQGGGNTWWLIITTENSNEY